MSSEKNERTARRDFVKHAAVGATGLAASSPSDFMSAVPDPVAQANRPNEYGNLIEATSNFKELLSKVVKEENIVSDPAVLDGYAKDYSFVSAGMPLLLVRPETREEVQQVVGLANKCRMPLVPVSSGPPRFHGDTVPNLAPATWRSQSKNSFPA
jgi:hypothetical protein